MSDWSREQQGKPSCFSEIEAGRDKRGDAEGLLEYWREMPEIIQGGLPNRTPGQGGMPSFRTIPDCWLSFESLLKVYQKAFGDDVSRYPTVPARLNLSDVCSLELGTLPERNQFRREGETWVVSYGGRTIRLRDTRGMRYLAHLLQHPNDQVSALELVQIVSRTTGEANPATTVDDDVMDRITGQPNAATTGDDDVMDAAYMSQLRERLVELGEARRDAAGDQSRLLMIDSELEALERQLQLASGLGGRSRRTSDDMERARKSVLNRIADVYERLLSEGHIPLHQHLLRHIKTGAYCYYSHPDPPHWDV